MTVLTIANPTLVNNLDDTQDSGHARASAPTGEKATARALLTALRTLHAVEQAQRPATPAERQALARFPGCGPVVSFSKEQFNRPKRRSMAGMPGICGYG